MLLLLMTTVIEAFVSTAPVASVTVPWIAAYTFCPRAIGDVSRQRIEKTAVAKKKLLSFIIFPLCLQPNRFGIPSLTSTHKEPRRSHELSFRSPLSNRKKLLRAAML